MSSDRITVGTTSHDRRGQDLTLMVAARDAYREDELLEPVRRRLAELAKLDPDWDSYGALPPTQAALDGALELAFRIERRFRKSVGDRVEPTSITPLPSGGIELEWVNPDKLVAVDVGPDGDYGYLRKTSSGRTAHYEERDHVTQETLLSVVATILLPNP